MIEQCFHYIICFFNEQIYISNTIFSAWKNDPHRFRKQISGGNCYPHGRSFQSQQIILIVLRKRVIYSVLVQNDQNSQLWAFQQIGGFRFRWASHTSSSPLSTHAHPRSLKTEESNRYCKSDGAMGPNLGDMNTISVSSPSRASDNAITCSSLFNKDRYRITSLLFSRTLNISSAPWRQFKAAPYTWATFF